MVKRQRVNCGFKKGNTFKRVERLKNKLLVNFGTFIITGLWTSCEGSEDKSRWIIRYNAERGYKGDRIDRFVRAYGLNLVDLCRFTTGVDCGGAHLLANTRAFQIFDVLWRCIC